MKNNHSMPAERGPELQPAGDATVAEMPLSDLQHRINYGSAVVGHFVDRITSAVEGIPRPNIPVALLGAAAVVSTGAAKVSESLASVSAKESAKPKITFYHPGDKAATRRAIREGKDCLPQELNLDPNASSSNPTGARHNKYARGSISITAEGRQRVKLIFKKGYRLGLAEITTMNYDTYFPSRNANKTNGNVVTYTDPYKKGDPSRHDIRSYYLCVARK